MTTPFWCLFIVVLIPYVIAGTGGYLRVRQLGSIDNKEPRTQALQLTGAAGRALAAQANAWEATAVFSAAVFTAHFVGVDAGSAATASIVFVVARILHAIFYLADLDKLRSLVFLVALISALSLFVMAIRAA